MIEKGNYGTLRELERMLLPNKKDIYVPQRLIQKHQLRDGSLVEGRLGRDRYSRLVDAPLAGKNQPGHDQGNDPDHALAVH